jgi:hypothetical protein
MRRDGTGECGSLHGLEFVEHMAASSGHRLPAHGVVSKVHILLPPKCNNRHICC